MKTLMIAPIALLLFAASCKKSADNPVPLGQTVVLRPAFPVDYTSKVSVASQKQIGINGDGTRSASMRRIDINENGQDRFLPDPMLHIEYGISIRRPYANTVTTPSGISSRVGGDRPPHKPNNWEKAPGPISAY